MGSRPAIVLSGMLTVTLGLAGCQCCTKDSSTAANSSGTNGSQVTQGFRPGNPTSSELNAATRSGANLTAQTGAAQPNRYTTNSATDPLGRPLSATNPTASTSQPIATSVNTVPAPGAMRSTPMDMTTRTTTPATGAARTTDNPVMPASSYAPAYGTSSNNWQPADPARPMAEPTAQMPDMPTGPAVPAVREATPMSRSPIMSSQPEMVPARTETTVHVPTVSGPAVVPHENPDVYEVPAPPMGVNPSAGVPARETNGENPTGADWGMERK
jgi:hypothetical protein